MDLANNNEAEAHFDDITEREDEIQMIIDARVEGMWQDKDTICRIIEENFDLLESANETAYDKALAFKSTITYYMELEAEGELG